MTSDLVVAPLLLVWFQEGLPHLRPGKILESTGLFGALVLIGLLVFSGKTPFAYLVVFPLLWAAFRFDKRGTTSSTVLMSGIAVWFTLQGTGPFATADPNRSLLMLQAFMGSISLTSLLLADAIMERKDAERALARANEELEKRVEEVYG